MRTVSSIGIVAVVGTVVALSGCASDTEPPPTPSTSAPVEASGLTLTGSNVKGSTSALNGQLKNESGEPVTVVGGSAYFATQLQVIRTSVVAGRTTTQVGVPLPIDANASVDLKPGGYQMRVIKLTQSLKKGSTVPINITLASGATMTAQAKVV